ncbi:spore gernimation protein GerPD [Paenibacillus sp. GD4]|jgi:spore germination protein PD|uniref:spore gernimation protein GerPD n=1 Tax=Paenibacillus TaxID=44249 RepID=UPI002542B962|nr:MULTISPECIES: spore gernimation protein GerPD [Paenibacillus]MDQ1913059.1 spore gernimation protein GerPD [Paenibacillus sp. GD4]
MILQVENKEISVGNIQVVGVASSSLLLIGDAQNITLSSVFDTPPESLIIGPLVPLAPETGKR